MLNLCSCRRRDAASAAPSAIDPYAALSLTSRTTRRNLHYQYNSHMMSMADMAEHLPTSKSLPSFEFAPHAGIKQARIPPILHDGKIDLDPTEWKPADPGFVSSSTGDPTEFQAGPGPAVVNDLNEKVVSSMAESRGSSSLVSSNSGVLGGRKPKLSSRPASSEAFTYLSQFHRSSDSLASSRPRLRTAVSVGIAPRTHRATPSLSFTSTTRSSSDSGSGSSSPKFQRSDDDDGNSSAAGSQGSSFASTPYEPPASIINKGKGPEAGKSPTREKPARGGSLTLPTTITAITVQAGAHDAEESKGEGESECAENDPANAIISRLSYEKKPLNTPTSPTGGATGAGPVSAAKGSLKKLLTGNDETI